MWLRLAFRSRDHNHRCARCSESSPGQPLRVVLAASRDASDVARRSGTQRAQIRISTGDGFAAKDASVILVLNQYKCIGCSPGIHSDTRRMAAASRTGRCDIAHDRYLCIAV